MSLAVKFLLGATVAGTAIAAWVVRARTVDRDAYLLGIRSAEHAEV